MKTCLLLCLAACLLIFPLHGEIVYDAQAKQRADQFFDATAYSAAISLYKNLLSTDCPEQEKQEIIYRLSTSYFFLDQYAEVVSLLEHYKIPANAYLLGCAYLKLGRYLQAKEAFECYLKLPGEQPFRQEAELQLIKSLIGLQDYEQAYPILEKMSHASISKRVKLACDLAITRLCLLRKDYIGAKNILTSMKAKLSENDIFHSEVENLNHYLSQVDQVDKILYFEALKALSVLETNPADQEAISQAEKCLSKGLLECPKGKFTDACWNLLGTLAYRQGNFKEAFNYFLKVEQENSNSSIVGESLYWAARCADELHDKENGRKLRRTVWEKYPASPYTPEAYFTEFSFKEYLQGDKLPIKHLLALPARYPESPFTIIAWYLIGLDFQREQKSDDGKKTKKRNLIASIDAFQKAEEAFLLLDKKNLISNDQEYYSLVRYQAALERAKTNLAIADESKGTKRDIYLEYGIELLQQLLKNLEQTNNLLKEEASYSLAKAYIQAEKDHSAELLLRDMLGEYEKDLTTRGLFLALVWNELGVISLRKHEYMEALHCFEKAEDAAKGKILTTDQKLGLWLNQSECHKALGDYDSSLILLSKVVNDDSISNLRIKAMFLRAEIYELQGRKELARRQLNSTAKNGGEWGVKSKEKLSFYGY